MKEKLELILKSIDYSWPKDLIIRYIYIKTAPLFKRDLTYFLKSKEEQVEIYKSGFTTKESEVVCSTLADFYVNLFQNIGINAKKIIAIKRLVPLFAIIVEGDYGWYYLDPLKDLFNNQYGLRPTEFAVMLSHKNSTLHEYSGLVTLDKEYLQEIDDYLGFKYLDEFFHLLHLEITDRATARAYFGENLSVEEMIMKKITFMNEQLLNIGNVTGLYERLQLHQFLKNQIYNNSEKKCISHKIVSDDTLNMGITPYNSDELIIFEEQNNDGVFRLERKK